MTARCYRHVGSLAGLGRVVSVGIDGALIYVTVSDSNFQTEVSTNFDMLAARELSGLLLQASLQAERRAA